MLWYTYVNLPIIPTQIKNNRKGNHACEYNFRKNESSNCIIIRLE